MYQHLLSNNNDFSKFFNTSLSSGDSISLIENPKPFYENNNSISLNIILIILFVLLIVYFIYSYKKQQTTL